SPKGDNGPIVALSWYEAAEYCNWLSAQEGIPPEQWCYGELVKRVEVVEEGNVKREKTFRIMQIKPNHRVLVGYRLPTEAEWEYASRAGATTSQVYGRGEQLLSHYAWYRKNSQNRTWPGGLLKPNDLGLFDTLGNAREWTDDLAVPYDLSAEEDKSNGGY